jgi:PAS domain S-box-containing protein
MAEEPVRQNINQERRLRLLVESVIDYAIYMLDPTGIVSSWNPGAQRIKGYTANEIVGRHFSQFYTDEDRANGLPAQSLRTALTEGRFEKEGWRLRKDGTRFWANVVIDPIRDPSGELIGFAKITRDITDRMKMQETLELTRAALAQSQKMEAVGQLTGGVAHDFNNLLTVIGNSVDLLANPTLSEKQRDNFLAAIRRATERGAKLTQQLLAFSRRQPLRPELHAIGPLVREFAGVLRRACGESVDIEIESGPDTVGVNLDAPQFEAALLNLVVNARDAMPDGGKLRVTVGSETVDAARAALIGDLAPGEYIAVAVVDSGSGMPLHVVEHAFEPFYTTKEVGKGTGLGLSQVYGFAKQLGGHAHIQSTVDRGTTVTLYLPATTEAAPATKARSANELPRPVQIGRILVVEDDADVRAMTVETLTAIGYEIVTAPDGVAALAILQRGDQFDVLFTDIVMPKGMTGLDLARQARALRPHLKVLLASGYPQAALPKGGTLDPEFAFLAKPYRWSELADRLRALR